MKLTVTFPLGQQTADDAKAATTTDAAAAATSATAAAAPTTAAAATAGLLRTAGQFLFLIRPFSITRFIFIFAILSPAVP
jgi:hypothetical protein